MPSNSQSYANHAHRPTAWNIVFVIGVVGVLAALWLVLRDPALLSAVVLLLAIALVGAVAVFRVYLLRVQDRVIRLEMRVRMARLGLEREFDQLAPRQLIALRFASDAEMPGLARRALAETLASDDIKRAVTDWQADHFRT